jgi:hypothetical protein
VRVEIAGTLHDVCGSAGYRRKKNAAENAHGSAFSM